MVCAFLLTGDYPLEADLNPIPLISEPQQTRHYTFSLLFFKHGNPWNRSGPAKKHQDVVWLIGRWRSNPGQSWGPIPQGCKLHVCLLGPTSIMMILDSQLNNLPVGMYPTRRKKRPSLLAVCPSASTLAKPLRIRKLSCLLSLVRGHLSL